MAELTRGYLAELTVLGEAPHGILVRTTHGEMGYIPLDYVSDKALSRDQWPKAGTVLRGLVLGRRSDGRVILGLRAVDGWPLPDSWPLESRR